MGTQSSSTSVNTMCDTIRARGRFFFLVADVERKRQPSGLVPQQCCGSSLKKTRVQRFTFRRMKRRDRTTTSNSWDHARSSYTVKGKKEAQSKLPPPVGRCLGAVGIRIARSIRTPRFPSNASRINAHSVLQSCHQRLLEEHPPALLP